VQPSPQLSIPTTACCSAQRAADRSPFHAGKQDRRTLRNLDPEQVLGVPLLHSLLRRLPSSTSPGLVPLNSDPDTVNVIAESNRGSDPATLAVRGTDEKGNVGSSASSAFSSPATEWMEPSTTGPTTSTTTQLPSIMRFDLLPSPPSPRFCQREATCRDGGNPHANTTALAVTPSPATESAWWLRRCFVGGLSGLRERSLQTKDRGDLADGRRSFFRNAAANRVMNASFNPDGHAVRGDAPAGDTLGSQLVLHERITGVRQSSLNLGFPVSYPDWVARRPEHCRGLISTGTAARVIQFQEAAFPSSSNRLPDGAPALPRWWWCRTRLARVATPRISCLTRPSCWYSEATRQTVTRMGWSDSYSDPSASVWPSSRKPNATPVLLARANATGVAEQAHPGLMAAVPSSPGE